MYAPKQEIWHTTYHHGGENQRIAPPSNNRFFFHQKRAQEPDYCNKNVYFYQQPHITSRSRPMESNPHLLYYSSQPSHARKEEQAWPVWSSEEYMRKILVRLLAFSKRTSYTRQCLKQTRFSAEKQRMFKKRKNPYSNDRGNHDEAVLIVDGANHPKDQRNNQSSHKMDGKWCRMVSNNNTERKSNANISSNPSSIHQDPKEGQQGGRRRLSMSIVHNEKPSRIQMEGFEW